MGYFKLLFYERLVSTKNKSDVANEITTLEPPKNPKDETQVFTSKYKLYLPLEEELLAELKRNTQH